MTVIAAFLWNKASPGSISTMIFDEHTLEYLSKPKIEYMPLSYVQFRVAAYKTIEEFFSKIKKIAAQKQVIVIEFRILFHVHGIAYLLPAKESQFVYKVFSAFARLSKKSSKNLQIKPQLRQRLSGKELKHFKKELRSLYLVSRKRDTGFEYHLWTVALHATRATYQKKLKSLRGKLLDNMWQAG